MINNQFWFPYFTWERLYRGELVTELNVERFELRKDGSISFNHPQGTHDDVLHACMARYNPFGERAGMKKILESKPNPAVLEAVEKLRKLGFNPVFLSSTKYNMQQMRNDHATINEVRTILKDISKAGGIYRKRLWSSHKAYMPKEKFNNCVDKAPLKKLAKMLRILSFLTQTKVYLFWKKHQS